MPALPSILGDAFMKQVHTLTILVLLLTIIGCASEPTIVATEEPPTSTPTLPNPQAYVTPAPDVDSAVERFMGAWQDDDYATMYALVTADTRGAVTEEAFTTRYLDTAIALTLKYGSGIVYEILSRQTNPDTAVVRLHVNYNTNLFGTLSREIELTMGREAGEWRVAWNEGMIIPDLIGGNSLEIVRQSTSRGDIYARDGSPIVAQEDAVAISFIPANLNEDYLSLFYATMARMTIYQQDEIIEIVENAQPNEFFPLGEVRQETVENNMGSLSLLSGVYLNYYTSRYYYDGGIAPQAVGHLTYISVEEMTNYLRLGYSPNERFGSTGLEFSFEDELSGERGASLYLKDSDGQIISTIAQKSAAPGQSLTTTLDRGLQFRLQKSLGNFNGAIVVMEIDTGRVLAMVSNPQFDPNLFDINNQNFIYATNPYSQPNNPVFNRATSGQYPLGSVFKIVTMAAGLDSGIVNETEEIFCGHSVDVCGNELFDWTYERELPPSGDLTLPGGLMRSCNPWFYLIGEKLFLEGNSNAIADMARSYGLGQRTGVEIPEQPGNIPAQVNSCELNAQLAIGQGEMTVTPLQTANLVAAVANGGTIYRPALVEKVGIDTGTPSYVFEPEIIGTLPVSDAHLTLIQDAMRSVITHPNGTANRQLATLRYRAFGKTGTAENPFGNSHAWFGGYTQVGNPERPDIAVVVILENAGEGSEMAAPVFRRVVSLYFSNLVDTGGSLRWEAYPYVVASPTPLPTDTPIPTSTPIFTPTPEGEEEPVDEP
jgi:penicillin-binding protein 2